MAAGRVIEIHPLLGEAFDDKEMVELPKNDQGKRQRPQRLDRLAETLGLHAVAAQRITHGVHVNVRPHGDRHGIEVYPDSVEVLHQHLGPGGRKAGGHRMAVPGHPERRRVFLAVLHHIHLLLQVPGCHDSFGVAKIGGIPATQGRDAHNVTS